MGGNGKRGLYKDESGLGAQRFSSLVRMPPLASQLHFLSVTWSAVTSCSSLVSDHLASWDGRKELGRVLSQMPLTRSVVTRKLDTRQKSHYLLFGVFFLDMNQVLFCQPPRTS